MSHECLGQSEAFFIIKQKRFWYVYDGKAEHKIPIIYCPYCGLRLDRE